MQNEPMPYLFLALAIGSELIATTLLKYTEGFTKLWFTLGCLVGYGFAFFMLSLAVRDIPVGVAYALWAGYRCHRGGLSGGAHHPGQSSRYFPDRCRCAGSQPGRG